MGHDGYYHMPKRVLVATLLLSFAIWVPLLAVPPIEDILVAELSLNHTESSLVYSGPILMLALVSVPAGLLADRLGIKKTAGTGAIIVAAGAIPRGTATSFPALLAAFWMLMALVGVATSTRFTTILTLPAEMTQHRSRPAQQAGW